MVLKALFFVLLLSFQEYVSVARNIEARTFHKRFGELFDVVHTNEMKKGVQQVKDGIQFDSDVLGFVELDSLSKLTGKSVMKTRTLEERTSEMRQIHKAISNSFSGHPNLHEINIIPLGVTLLSEEDLKRHETEVSLFLQKSLTPGASKEIDTVVSEIETKVRPSSFGSSFAMDVVTGFFDGFTSGALTDLKQEWSGKQCKMASRAINKELTAVIRSYKALWKGMSGMHKKLWSEKGRDALLQVVRNFFKTVYRLLLAFVNSMYLCKANLALVILTTVLLIASGLQMVMTAVTGGILALIKLCSIVYSMFISMPYLIKTLSVLRAELGKSECDTKCKRLRVQKISALFGVVLELFTMSGLSNILKFAKIPKVAAALAKLNIRVSSNIARDLHTIKNLVQSGKKISVKSIKWMTSITPHQKAYSMYKAKAMLAGKKVISFKRYAANMNNLKKANAARLLKSPGSTIRGAKPSTKIALKLWSGTVQSSNVLCDRVTTGFCRYIADEPKQEVRGLKVKGLSAMQKRKSIVQNLDPLNWLIPRTDELREHHNPQKFGVLGTCSGDVSGLCFDSRLAACNTGRSHKHGRCPGKKNILCCPGAEVIKRS